MRGRSPCASARKRNEQRRKAFRNSSSKFSSVAFDRLLRVRKFGNPSGVPVEKNHRAAFQATCRPNTECGHEKRGMALLISALLTSPPQSRLPVSKLLVPASADVRCAWRLVSRRYTADDVIRRAYVQMILEPEPLCDGCPSRCAGCPWAWMDDDFIAEGGDEEALQQRDVLAREELGLEPLQQQPAGAAPASATTELMDRDP